MDEKVLNKGRWIDLSSAEHRSPADLPTFYDSVWNEPFIQFETFKKLLTGI